MAGKLKSVCQVLKDMKLYKKTAKVIAKNATKGKKKGRSPAKEVRLSDFLGVTKKDWHVSE